MLAKFAPLVVCCALAALPVMAQSETPTGTDQPAAVEAKQPEAVEEGRRQGWGLRLAYLTGDEVTKSPGWEGVLEGIPGQIEMDDTPLIGGQYWIDASKAWRVELRLAAGPTTLEPACPNAAPNSGDSCAANKTSVDGILWYTELVVMPHFDWGEWHLGIPAGYGWTALRADEDLAPEGAVSGRDDRTKMADSSGAHYFLGLRGYRDLGGGRSAYLEVRRINMHRIVGVNYATVRSVEVSVGMDFQF